MCASSIIDGFKNLIVKVNGKLTITNYSEGLTEFCEVITRQHALLPIHSTLRMIARRPCKYIIHRNDKHQGYMPVKPNTRNIRCFIK